MRLSEKARLGLLLGCAILAPGVAQAQACSSSDNSGNPLVGQGYHAFVRINNNYVDYSCRFVNQGGGVIAFDDNQQFTIGSGQSAIKAFLYAAMYTGGATPSFAWQVGSSIGALASSSANFAFAFSAPLDSGKYGQDAAYMSISKTSPPGSQVNKITSATFQGIGGVVSNGVGYEAIPSYLVGHPDYMDKSYGGVSAGGGAANSFQFDLGVDAAGTNCGISDLSCGYFANDLNPEFLEAWGAVISYSEVRVPNSATSVGLNGSLSIVSAVPEPASVALLGTGLLSMLVAVRRRNRNAA